MRLSMMKFAMRIGCRHDNQSIRKTSSPNRSSAYLSEDVVFQRQRSEQWIEK